MAGKDYTVSQFDTTQYHQAYSVLSAICGPNVAEAFMNYYGSKKFTPDQIVSLAKDAGLWSQQVGMFGPGSEKALLDRLGVPVDYSPTINLKDLQDKVMAGYMGAVSTPGHYFALQGYDPATQLWDTGNTGTAYKAGNRFLTWDQMAKIGGTPSGQFIANQLPGSVPNTSAGADRFSINPNDPNSISDYIRIAAQARGIDPEIAVRVAQSEGLNTYVGDSNSSFGPFQLHYGNVAGGGNAVAGLGDAFTKATGLDARNPDTIAAQIDFSLDQAAQNGWSAWHGASRAGVGPFSGIGSTSKPLGQQSPASGSGTNVPSTGPRRPANIPDWVPQSMWNMYESNQYGNYNPGTSALTPSLNDSSSSRFETMPYNGGAFNWQDSMNQWNATERQSFQNPPSMVPMSSSFSPYNAPQASQNIMSLMSRPGSLYG